MEEINENFQKYKSKKMFIFCLIKNLVKFMDEKSHLKLIFEKSDFIGEYPGICESLILNTLNLFKNLIGSLENDEELETIRIMCNQILESFH